MNKKADYLDILPNIFMTIVFVILLVTLVCYVYSAFYIEPIAQENANIYCRSRGFDQFKSYKTIGLFNVNPTGVTCEYAERYTDLGVRTNE